MKNLFLFLCAVFLSINLLFSPSCSHERSENEKQLNVFDVFSSRDALLSLSVEEQKQAWILRFESYSELDLTSAQKVILNDLIYDFKQLGKGEFFLSEKIKQDAIAMAKITPREDFINLFSVETLTPGLPKLLKTGSICVDCIADIETYGNQPSDGAVTYRTAPSCNCNWTCGYQAGIEACLEPQVAVILPACSGGGTSGCCTGTGGCGFVGLGTCNGKVQCSDPNDG